MEFVRSSWPSGSGKPGVAVVGRGRGLDAVAHMLERREFAVTRIEDTRAQTWKSWRSGRSVIVGDAKTLARLKFISEEGAVLALVTRQHFEGYARSHVEDERSDFVRVKHGVERQEPDESALDEIVLRVRRLVRVVWPRTSGAEATDVVAELHDEATGRIDAQRVAKFLGTSLKGLADAIDRKYTTVHKTPTADGLQEPLGPIVRIVELLVRLGKSKEEVRIWLNAPHGELKERTPLSVIAEGRAEVVRDMVLGAYMGLPT